jgi:hypothetical protein
MKRSHLVELIKQESDQGMRNQNLAGSTHRRSAGGLGMPAMPLEWLDAGSWRLPSGKALAEFALQAGFLVPQLFRSDGFDSQSQPSGSDPGLAESSAQAPAKENAKGGSR